MSPRSRLNLLSTIGLVLLALVAAGLSAAALTQNRLAPSEAVPSNEPSATVSQGSTPEVPKTPGSQPAATPESTPSDSASTDGVSVVVLGDGYSADDAPGVWVTSVAERLGWGTVTNLSTSGRGYLRNPGSCDISVCANFMGTVSAVVAEDPDVVITFGGTADGDSDLTDAAATYFAALREALPDAELIAISPVTSGGNPEYWLTMHTRTIQAGVEAAGGTFIDVGQPGVGDGEELSAGAQAEIAQTVIDELS